MREATNGRHPTFAVWENVPGALSSSGGDDFLAVLENLAKIADPEVSIPKPDKWCANGEIVGNGWSIAWRIIDARHFGVTVRDGDTGDVLVRGTPQRRRRIYLVADFGGARAGKILFECAGVPGDSEPCAETRKGTSADAEGSVGGAVCYGISAYESNAMKSSNPHSGIYEADTSRTLDLNGGNPACNQGGIAVVETAAGFLDRNSANARSIGYEDEEAPTIRESMTPSVVCCLFENHSQDTRFKGPLDVSPMLPAQLGTGGNNTPFVLEQTYCLQGSMIGRADKNGPQGDGVNEDVCFTCNTTDRHAVAYALDQQGGKGGANYAEDVMPTLCSDSHGTPHAVAYVESYQKVTGPLMANSHPGSYCGQDAYSDMLITPIPYRQGGFADYVENEVGTVRAAGGDYGGDYGGGTETLVRKNYLVRRLTPTECARLQGFPDAWGHPEVKTELTDDEYTFWQTVRDTHAEINGKPQKTYTREQMLKWYNNLHTDSAEYKMWGNGIALPCAHFVLNRIAKELVKQP
jgi:DNA (cytosine-5)-methyltransferase 1